MTDYGSKHIIWFDNIRKGDVGRVGGKGANLGELTVAGLPVPPGFVVPATSYFDFIKEAGLEPQINSLLDGLDVDNATQLALRAEEIQRIIIQASMPEGLQRAIRDAYQQLDGGRCDVAVRSSATAEDLPEASFAGQQSTFLNINGADDAVHAVQACMASLFNGNAIFYREQQGFGHMSVGLAVVVQKMVQSAKAGVMFTKNGTNGNPDHIQISAGYGLGEAVVSGSVTPDAYFFSKGAGQIISRTIKDQQKMLVRDPDGEGSPEEANKWVSVPSYLQSAQTISDEEILALADIGMRVERHYGGPQDIEYAIDSDGDIWLTQARPLTVNSLDYLISVPLIEDETARLLIETELSAGVGVASGNVRILQGPDECHLVQEGDVMVVSMTDPGYVSAMKRASAIIAEEGDPTCHAAIVCRELGVPCIVGAKGARNILKPFIGQKITVDASHRQVFEDDAATRHAWEVLRKEAVAELEAKMEEVTTNTKVMTILADPEEVATVAAGNVDGIALLRMEFILEEKVKKFPRWFIDQGCPEEYTRLIAESLPPFCSAMGDRPVILRMNDMTHDKSGALEHGADYKIHVEWNPQLGERGCSFYRANPDIFALEVAAVVEVRRTYKNLHVMLPFVRTLDDLRWALDFMAEHGLRRGDDGLLIWMMAEVPSNVFLLEQFIDQGIDGVSIGSNDLTGLVLGCDRENGALNNYDERDPAVVEAIKQIVTRGRACGATVSICGQAPSNYPEYVPMLVEWGVTSIGVMPDSIARTRALVAMTELEKGLITL